MESRPFGRMRHHDHTVGIFPDEDLLRLLASQSKIQHDGALEPNTRDCSLGFWPTLIDIDPGAALVLR